MLNPTSGCFTFRSRPRPVEDRSKNIGPPSKQTRGTHGNIMSDRRIVRGNTYSRPIRPTAPQPDPGGIQRHQSIRRRAFTLKPAKEQFRTWTPEAVQGRKHIEVQTEVYLEDLSAFTETADVHCQTDDFLDRPATPLFIPAKSGKDVATQIEEGELFDFDWEVQPMLEVLVGKTIEQSLLEVMEEEELACLKAQQKAFRELRDTELAELQRLQEQERRRSEEKERRIAQHKAVLEKERETAKKMAVQAYVEQFMADIQPAVNTSLRRLSILNDPVEQDIRTNFFSWLMAEVYKRLEKRYATRALLDNIIHDVIQKRL